MGWHANGWRQVVPASFRAAYRNVSDRVKTGMNWRRTDEELMANCGSSFQHPLFEKSIKRKPWTAEFTAQFIDLYKNLPSLWKIKCLDYGNRPKKAIAYKKLVNLVKTVDETADNDFVKSKINTLRSCFRKELQKVRNCKGPNSKEPARATKLWYFDKMMFLVEQEQDAKSHRGGGEEADAQRILLTQSPTTVEVTVIDADMGTAPKPTNSGCLLHENRSPDTCRRRKTAYNGRNCEPGTRETAEKKTTAAQGANADEFDAFATIVSAKLRSMDNVQRLFAEKLITDALYKGLFQQLTARTEIADRPEFCDSSNNYNDAGTSPNAEMEPQIDSCPVIEICTMPL